MALFFAAFAANSFGLLYVCLILPESLKSSKAPSASMASTPASEREPQRGFRQMIKHSVEPLLLLAPRKEEVWKRGRRTWRWNFDLTLLGTAVFCAYLTVVSALCRSEARPNFSTVSITQGVMPNKYLYAEHMFGWTAVEVSFVSRSINYVTTNGNRFQLGEYISIAAACRGLWLIVLLPRMLK